jgi:hypothetical protein
MGGRLMGGKKGGTFTGKLRIISEPKIIYVQPGYLAGSSDRVQVDVCTTCSAVVFDSVAHDLWHRSAERAVD